VSKQIAAFIKGIGNSYLKDITFYVRMSYRRIYFKVRMDIHNLNARQIAYSFLRSPSTITRELAKPSM
jgi:hypothetical protein